MTRIRNIWSWRAIAACAVVLVCSRGDASHAANSGTFLVWLSPYIRCIDSHIASCCNIVALLRDGSTTYCWGLNVAASVAKVSPQSVFASGSGVNCPLAITIATKDPVINIGQAITVTWIVSSQNTTNSNASSGISTTTSNIEHVPFIIAHSAVHACTHESLSPSALSSASSSNESVACDPFSADFQSANLSASQSANFSSFSGRDTIRFRSINEISFVTPGEYTLAAYVVVPDAAGKNQRYDFVVYTRVQVLPNNTQVGAASDNETNNNRSRLPFNVSMWQFMLICTLLVFIVCCAIAVLVLVAKRRRLSRRARDDDDARDERAKVSQTAALSPVTGDSQGQFRFSDWSEIYATQDTMPISILVDDSNTIAILRASRVSSPAASAVTERKIADFTREIGYWDVRPSASPITPLSNFFFPPSLHEDDEVSSLHEQQYQHERDCELASPMDSFVPLETLGRRRTRPCHADALDHEGFSDSDEEAQEVDF